MHFSWRGVDEHRRVCYGDFELGKDDEDVEYVELKTDRETNTRNGYEGAIRMSVQPKDVRNQ